MITNDSLARIERHIPDLINPDQEIAARAERRLLRFGNKAVPALLPLATHPSPEVRFRVVWILGLTKDTRAFETIVKLVGDPDERVQYDALVALGKHGDPRAAPILWSVVRKDGDLGLTSAAQQGLAELGVCFLAMVGEV